MKRILFLYTEIAGYVVACLNTLAAQEGVEVGLVKWSTKAEAPFQLEIEERIAVHAREDHTNASLQQLCEDFHPDLICITGWMDKTYVKIGRHFRKKNIPCLLGLDNPWTGSWRQKIGTATFPFYLRGAYSHAWVAGERQQEFARRLGFADSAIITGYYSADVKAFQRSNFPSATNYPKTILYVGRFLEWKGVRDLYHSFANIQARQPNDWQLLLVGNGHLQNELSATDKIKIQAFVQPKELQKLAQEVGAFCLPSHHEHWGVVVHEFAAAGLPLLVSDGVNAATAFVRSGENGFLFAAGNTESLEDKLLELMQSPPDKLLEMGKRSAQLALQLTPEIWAKNILNVLN